MEIKIQRLTKDYGRVRALEDVSLHVRGGMFGLLGPNGAGKTTLMRILTTLLRPTSGAVTIEGVDVLHDPGWIRQRLGYIPQDFGFYGRLTAFEILDYVGAMKNVPSSQRRKQVESVLEEVNLTEYAHRKVGGFSGGMRQRLGIAQALLGDPELLVVDEPTAGLDPEERIRFRNLLARLSRQRTVILSTHIVADIEASCSGVAVLNQGRLVYSGTPQALAAEAEGQVWQVEIPTEAWPSVEARYPILSSRVYDGRIQVRLLSAGTPPGQARLLEPGLEDGYVAVVKGLTTGEVNHA
ncbi:MAG: ABC transporter ATP-binding protein [Chloroflexota bacterium]